MSTAIKSMNLILGILLCSCGTKPMKSTMPVAFASKPSNAEITISDSIGNVVFSGLTPCRADLKRKAGKYSPANYTAKFSLRGWQSKEIGVSSSMNDADLWKISNITILPLLSRLLFEPIANNSFVLPESVSVNLQKIQ
jgi:hypothetical protein